MRHMKNDLYKFGTILARLHSRIMAQNGIETNKQKTQIHSAAKAEFFQFHYNLNVCTVSVLIIIPLFRTSCSMCIIG